ncbi:MAG TPA: hypothetical protein VHM90_10145 [Phycisphaerae bacterium]|jgi:hypothetical protein|nr:hypothetical protein [Phycisphaerae bacterium]
MKNAGTAAASGFAICLLLVVGPVLAQGGNPAGGVDRPDAGRMPADHSTPAERAQTRALNNQVQQSNAAADAKAAEDNARYQQERAHYAEQNARYQDAMQRHAMQERNYHERRQAYEALRARYAAERAAYRRHEWPRHDWVVLGRDSHPVGERVQLIDGDRVGTVSEEIRDPAGRIEALEIRLDSGERVWIDNSDIRYNRADGVLMTNLDRRDLHAMAAERP